MNDRSNQFQSVGTTKKTPGILRYFRKSVTPT